jgi:hypothetical protein
MKETDILALVMNARLSNGLERVPPTTQIWLRPEDYKKAKKHFLSSGSPYLHGIRIREFTDQRLG